MTGWIDAHCHLADPRFEKDLIEVVARSKEANVNAWLQGGVSPDDWKRQRQLKGRLGDGVFLSFGVHPWWVASHSPLEVKVAVESLEKEMDEADAVGEMGLDFLPKFEGTEEKQTAAFKTQLLMAKAAQKPLVLHVVHAHGPALDILEDGGPYSAGGLIHAFSGSLEVAQRYLSLGFLISLGAAALRDEAKKTKDMICSLPSETFVVETDAPDQLPKFLGLPPGSLNEPKFLIPMAARIGEIRGEPVEKVLSHSSRNLRGMLGKLSCMTS